MSSHLDRTKLIYNAYVLLKESFQISWVGNKRLLKISYHPHQERLRGHNKQVGALFCMLNEVIVIDIIPLSLCPLLQWQRVTSVVTPEPSNVAHKRGHITPTLACDQIFDANVIFMAAYWKSSRLEKLFKLSLCCLRHKIKIWITTYHDGEKFSKISRIRTPR